MAVHKGTAYAGEHAAIIDQVLWDKVHAILAENTRTRSANTRAQTPALLRGLIFGPTGAAMSPTHTRKGNRLYRYYVSQHVLKRQDPIVQSQLPRLPNRPKSPPRAPARAASAATLG